MLTLSKKLKQQGGGGGGGVNDLDLNPDLNNHHENQETNNNNNNNFFKKRITSIRDKLLVKELSDLTTPTTDSVDPTHHPLLLLPPTTTLTHPDPDKLHEFVLSIAPEEGFWVGGRFQFLVIVPEGYNFEPPTVRCLTPIFHPNISSEKDGGGGGINNGDGYSVCLSLLRPSVDVEDGCGWAPTRTLKDLVWGLNAIFTDLLNFDDPLNPAASDLHSRDPVAFKVKVREVIREHCS